MYHQETTTICIHSPYVTLLHRNMAESQPYIPVDYTFSYHSHDTKFRDENFKHFGTSVGMIRDWGGGPLSSKFANGRQAIVKGQGCFAHCVLLRDEPPIM